jgi:hypothetical protein
MVLLPQSLVILNSQEIKILFVMQMLLLIKMVKSSLVKALVAEVISLDQKMMAFITAL